MATRRSARLSAASEKTSALSASAEMLPPPKPATKSTTTRKRKAPAAEPRDDPSADAPVAVPKTPKKPRSVAAAAPPVTPTPSAVRLISEPCSSPLTPQRHRPVARLADPRATNAQLVSPVSSRVVSRPPIEDAPPSSPSKPTKPETTTANLLDEACAHLIRVDPRMKPLVDAHHCHIFSPEGLAEQIDPFESLVSGIISQQVSGAAAKSIKARFVALYLSDADGQETPSSRPKFPSPTIVAATSLERLRTAGLSQRKAEYIQGLAEKFASGELSTQLLADAPYEEVLARLIAVRGLGRWSVEMFACFALKRMDVFSLGDLGVQRGMAAFAGRDVARLKNVKSKWKYMSERDMVELSDRFKPYRSLFMWYMWRVEETDVSTME